ncbi:peptidase inhibitor family I36 protein [Nonomuraea sp. NPDC003214]
MLPRLTPLRVAAVTLITLSGFTAMPMGAAQADRVDPSVQEQVDSQLHDYPGGVQSAPGVITYAGGSVKVVIPRAGAAATCPSGWYCFFQDRNWIGRMLQFRDCGGNQSLTDYGFGNQATSWVNNTRHLVEVYDRDVDPFDTLWREAANARASYVEAGKDNRADFFHTYCGS